MILSEDAVPVSDVACLKSAREAGWKKMLDSFFPLVDGDALLKGSWSICSTLNCKSTQIFYMAESSEYRIKTFEETERHTIGGMNCDEW